MLLGNISVFCCFIVRWSLALGHVLNQSFLSNIVGRTWVEDLPRVQVVFWLYCRFLIWVFCVGTAASVFFLKTDSPHLFVALALGGTRRSWSVVVTVRPQKELFLWEALWSRLSNQQFRPLTFSLHCVGKFQNVGCPFSDLQICRCSRGWRGRTPSHQSDADDGCVYSTVFAHCVPVTKHRQLSILRIQTKMCLLFCFISLLSLPDRPDVWLHHSPWEMLSSCLSVLILPSHSRLLSSDTFCKGGWRPKTELL